MDIIIEGRLEERRHSARIILSFSEVPHADMIVGKIELDFVSSTVVGPCCFYGFNVLELLNGLKNMHKTLEGSARLVDIDEETILCFTVTDVRRGQISIGGKLRFLLSRTDSPCEDIFIGGPANAGLLVLFDGIIIDQSYLPELVAGFTKLLNETQVPVEHPFLRAPQEQNQLCYKEVRATLLRGIKRFLMFAKDLRGWGSHIKEG